MVSFGVVGQPNSRSKSGGRSSDQRSLLGNNHATGGVGGGFTRKNGGGIFGGGGKSSSSKRRQQLRSEDVHVDDGAARSLRVLGLVHPIDLIENDRSNPNPNANIVTTTPTKPSQSINDGEEKDVTPGMTPGTPNSSSDSDAANSFVEEVAATPVADGTADRGVGTSRAAAASMVRGVLGVGGGCCAGVEGHNGSGGEYNYDDCDDDDDVNAGDDDVSDLTGHHSRGNGSGGSGSANSGILGDPPGRSLSVDEATNTAADRRRKSGNGNHVNREPTSLVNNLLCMMDKACVAPANNILTQNGMHTMRSFERSTNQDDDNLNSNVPAVASGEQQQQPGVSGVSTTASNSIISGTGGSGSASAVHQSCAGGSSPQQQQQQNQKQKQNGSPSNQQSGQQRLPLAHTRAQAFMSIIEGTLTPSPDKAAAAGGGEHESHKDGTGCSGVTGRDGSLSPLCAPGNTTSDATITTTGGVLASPVQQQQPPPPPAQSAGPATSALGSRCPTEMAFSCTPQQQHLEQPQKGNDEGQNPHSEQENTVQRQQQQPKHENFEMILRERKHYPKKKISLKLPSLGLRGGHSKNDTMSSENNNTEHRNQATKKAGGKFGGRNANAPTLRGRQRNRNGDSNKTNKKQRMPRLLSPLRWRRADEEEKKEEDEDNVELPPGYYVNCPVHGNNDPALDDTGDYRHDPSQVLAAHHTRGGRGTAGGLGSGNAPVMSPKALKEARYKQMLNAFKSMNQRTPLETVHEEAAVEDDYQPNEATELKVRVPGLLHPDAFISDKDLIGDEIGSEASYCNISAEHDDDVEETDGSTSRYTSSVNDSAYGSNASYLDAITSFSRTTGMTSDNKFSTGVSDSSAFSSAVPIDRSDTAEANLDKAHPTASSGKRYAAEVEHMSESPSATGEIRRSQTWIEKLAGGFHLSYDDPASEVNGYAEGVNSKTGSKMSRQRSAPEKLSKENGGGFAAASTPTKAAASSEAKEPPKKIWRAATCPKTGRMYYYHRITRQTTWTKPPDDELYVPTNIRGNNHNNDDDKKEKEAGTTDEDEIRVFSNSPVAENFDDDDDTLLESLQNNENVIVATNVKQEVVDILKSMSPPDGKSVDRLMAQYDGREEELLAHLKEIAESHPFDEPVGKNRSVGQTTCDSSTEQQPQSKPPQVISARTLGTITEDPTLGGFSSRTLKSRSRTQTSLVSGFSSALMSASTQQIKNTAKGRLGQDVIPETESHATSISSKLGYMLPPAGSLDAKNGSPVRVPSNIPVPRTRDLVVEDFSSHRYKAQTFGMNGVLRPEKKKAATNEDSPMKAPDNADYYGDNEDTDTKDTDTFSIPNDSISALSEADLSSNTGPHSRKDPAYDIARRRALDEAIARKDWDLAAALSEGMRTIKAAGGHRGAANQEWTQTQLDRFISENDWDAVANYIAHVREESKSGKRGKVREDRGGVQRRGPQKRFGAKSQLQHRNLNFDDGSWDSPSSSYSESESSSVSSYTEEQPYNYPRSRRHRNMNFAC